MNHIFYNEGSIKEPIKMNNSKIFIKNEISIKMGNGSKNLKILKMVLKSDAIYENGL